MAEILAARGDDTVGDHKLEAATDEVVSDQQLEVFKGGNDGLGDEEEEEISMELEDILKTCNGIQTKVGREARSGSCDEKADNGKTISCWLTDVEIVYFINRYYYKATTISVRFGVP